MTIKNIRHAGLLVMALPLAACQLLGVGVASQPNAPKKLTVTPAATSLYLPPASEAAPIFPTFVVLEAKFSDARLTATSVQWVSTDPAIASVDSEGKVSAVATGSAVVTGRLTDDQAVLATASVQVLDGGRANVTVR